VRGDRGRVEGVHLQDELGTNRTIRAGLVVGADGLRSSVAGLVNAPETRRSRAASAAFYGYWSGLAADGFNWHWGHGAACGTIPTNDGHVLVYVGVSAQRFAAEVRGHVAEAFGRLVEEVSPGLAAAMRGARLAGSLHGFSGHPGFLRRPWGPGWALVGDAAYFKDPITAHGISDALRDAELLARAVLRGTDEALGEYETRRDILSTALFDVTDRIASFEWDHAELKLLHHALSDEMKHEAAALVELHEDARLAAGEAP
jgi:flavin-dependent dehydrogenase